MRGRQPQVGAEREHRSQWAHKDAAVTCNADGNEEPLCNTNSLNVFVLPFLSEAAQGSPKQDGSTVQCQQLGCSCPDPMQEEMSASQGGSRGTQQQGSRQHNTWWVQIPLHFGETTEAFKNTPIKA